MDLRKAITYGNSYDLNDADVSGDVIEGNQINELNISPVSEAGYIEKKAITEGMDASDVYSAARTIRIVGQTSGDSAASTYDAFQDLLAALSPTDAFRQDSDNKGYLPLSGVVPTEDTSYTADDDGLYFVPIVIFCRPKNPPQFSLNRDRVGGPDRGLSIPWQVTLEAKDPRIYIDDEQEITLTGTSGAGNLTNRGRFPTPLSVLLAVKANQTERVFTLTIPETVMAITLENNAAVQQFWYDGYRKLLYRKIGTGGWTKAMSLLSIDNPARALPEDSGGTYTWTLTGDVLSASVDSTISYFEAWG